MDQIDNLLTCRTRLPFFNLRATISRILSTFAIVEELKFGRIDLLVFENQRINHANLNFKPRQLTHELQIELFCSHCSIKYHIMLVLRHILPLICWSH